MRRLALALTTFALAGCYESHLRSEEPPTICDHGARPICVTRAAPCAPLQRVPAICDEPTLAWQCPLGATVHTTTPWPDGTCLPLEGEAGLVHEAPVAFEQDGQCRWWFPALDVSDSARSHVIADLPEPGGGCAGLTLSGEAGVLDTPDGADFAAVQGALPDASGSRILTRGWIFDPMGGFGITSVGVGLARRVGARYALDQWLFDPSLDLGDAIVAFEDHAYAFGCPGDPEWLEEDCIVARAPLASIDDRAAWRTLGDRDWGEGVPLRVFGAGPHRSAVVADPRGVGFIHVFAIGFGDDLMIQRAPRPEGPWSPAELLVRCDLPPDDPEAYCAGPAVHVELHDPLRPDALVLSYSVGTLAPDGAARRALRPRDYWVRIVRVD